MKNTKTPFKPKARLMELLGEQLIRSHILALFELVKNSYDAFSTETTIRMLDVSNGKDGFIEVEDNGSGMSFEVVRDIWMEPGHPNRQKQRETIINNSDPGIIRLPVGEKGVGRFAAHRLGTNITLVTRSANCEEVIVEIDWEKFASNNYLEKALVEISERPAKVFTGDKTGTRITIGSLKQAWKRGDIRKLYRQTNSMTMPSVLEEKADNFKVNFEIFPNREWLEDLLDPSEINDHSMFRFDFTFDNEGYRYKYSFTPLPGIKADYGDSISERVVELERKHSEFFTLCPPGGDSGTWGKRKKRPERPKLSGEHSIGTGAIKGSILGFDLDPEIKRRYLKDEAGGITDYMRDNGGIRVYRDGLRVYEYGEPGNDWLGLDHRRTQSPTKRLGNRIMLGELHLDLKESSLLKEKTSREGFIENDAYQELRYAALCALADFETERNKDKTKLRNALSSQPNSYIHPIKKKSVEGLLKELKETAKTRDSSPEVINLIDQVGSAYTEARDALLSSAGAGLGLITVFHELERGMRGLHRSIDRQIDHKTLIEQSNDLIAMFKGVMYLVSKKSMETISASELVRLALSTQKLRWNRHNVKVLNGFDNLTNDDFNIRCIRRMAITTIVNIVDNALYWMDQDEDENILWVGPSHDLEGPAIIIADSGPGFLDDPEDMTEPFFSRRPEGMGVGLYYSDWVMRSHAGRLAFPNRNDIDIPRAVNGAVVALVFNKKDKK